MIEAGLQGWAVRVPTTGSLGPAPLRVRRDVVVGMGLWAIDAAREAWGAVEHPERTGLYVGMGGLRPGWDELMPPLSTQRSGPPWAEGLRRFHPFWMLRNLSNNVHATLAEELGIRHDGATYGGEAAGGVALHAALEALHLGVIDQALVVAYDSLRQPELRVERGELSEGAAAVVLGRSGRTRIRTAKPGALEEHSPYGAAHLVIRAIELRDTGGMVTQRAEPGNVVAIEVSC